MVYDANLLRQWLEELGHADPSVRQAAKLHLKRIGPSIVDDLVAAMLAQTGRQSIEAANLLLELNDPRAAEGMARMLSSSYPVLAHIALEAMLKLKPADLPQILLQAIPTSTATLQLLMIKSLGQLGDQSAVRPLMAILEGAEAGSTRYTTIQALSQLGDPQAIELIGRFREDPDHHVRTYCQQALDHLSRQPAPPNRPWNP